MFRRKPVDLVTDAVEATTVDAEAESQSAAARPKGYTPSKRELGRETPKRVSAQRRRVAEPAPGNRREAYKQLRARQRAERAEAQAGMRRGEERYLLRRDRGPERALVRDIVDSRRTVGTWFFAGAIIVLFGSSPSMPFLVQMITNIVWVALAVGVILDSVLISRRIRKLITQRFPNTTERLGSLYLYGVMRGLTFRKMRIPNPRVSIGDRI